MSSTSGESGFRKSSRVQFAEVIRNQILNEEFKPGEKLPTTMAFVQLAGVSSHTVRLGLRMLEDEGFVTSTQGSGTFVVDVIPREEASPEIATVYQTKTIAIMGVFSSDTELPERYQRETAAGFIAESQKLGLAAHIMAPQLRGESIADIISALKAINADGVIWPAPWEKEWDKIEALRNSGFQIVATQRADSDSWLPAVAGDYQTAGADVGEYFIKKACQEMVVFTYFASYGKLPITMADGVPSGFITGILNAFGRSGNVSNDLVSLCCNKGYNAQVSDAILKKLETVAPDVGVIFANAYQFGDLLIDRGDDVHELLKQRHVVVLSNPTVIQRLTPLVGNLDISFLVDPYEKIARFAVQKLCLQMDGNVSDAKSLLKVALVRANDWQEAPGFGR